MSTALATRRCGSCTRRLPYSEYYPRSDRAGLRSVCKACNKSQSLESQRSRRKPRITAEQRFWKKVTKKKSCWMWTGSLHRQGYGMFRHVGGVLAHRFSYQTFVGTIPAGMVLDHLCRNTSCVNPKHLEPVSQRENIARGESPSAIHIRSRS